MVYRISLALILLFTLLFTPAAVGYSQVAAQESATAAFDLSGLPPGVAKKVSALLDELMSHHHMGHCEHHAHHMGQIQQMIDQLPPGILVGVLEAMLDFDMEEMMAFHTAIDDGLLAQPPGQILNFVQELAQ